MFASLQSDRRAAYENYATPEAVPEFELVPLKAARLDERLALHA